MNQTALHDTFIVASAIAVLLAVRYAERYEEKYPGIQYCTFGTDLQAS
ncbi:hypothetical protein WKN60_004184 [Escherichia coli]|nr:hypothetical protein [Escherichia coli]EKG6905404.1 hypothetical protein [Escherichia coli]